MNESTKPKTRHQKKLAENKSHKRNKNKKSQQEEIINNEEEVKEESENSEPGTEKTGSNSEIELKTKIKRKNISNVQKLHKRLL